MGVLLLTVTSFAASLLTLFSGFGLGTILMPVAALFFPVATAVSLTAFVHLLNNLFKLSLLRTHVCWPVVLRFGLPAMVLAVPGAWLLAQMAVMPALCSYQLGTLPAVITPVKLVAGLLLIIFATMEWLPLFSRIKLSMRWLPFGGALSGFFGGLTGHQGAFRSLFLIRAGLDKNQFVASNAAIASMVDVARLIVYGLNMQLLLAHVDAGLLALATLASFGGVWTGTVFLHKMTIALIQKIVAIMIYLLGILLVAGLI